MQGIKDAWQGSKMLGRRIHVSVGSLDMIGGEFNILARDQTCQAREINIPSSLLQTAMDLQAIS